MTTQKQAVFPLKPVDSFQPRRAGPSAQTETLRNIRRTRPGGTIASLLTLATLSVIPADLARAAGTIRGNAGGYEREVAAFAADGRVCGWAITGGDGYYEFAGLEPGSYMLKIHDNIAPLIRVDDHRATAVNYASQLALASEFEVWTPARVRFAQSFVASGTAVQKLTLWRATGGGRLEISLFEESPQGRRVAGPFLTEKDMAWVCSTYLPAGEFKTTPGKRYALEIEDAAQKPWTVGMPRIGDVHPDGIAWFDGVPHPESDLGIIVEQERPGPTLIARADWDLHFIAEGPGSGFCRVAGQTFVANARNVIRAYANCGWSGPPQDFIFSIHEVTPGGKQLGPACRLRMVPNWGSHALWAPADIELTPGREYRLEYRRADGEPFFSYLSKDLYKQGRAYRDGRELPEQFDQWFEIIGEQDPGATTFPCDVRVRDITPTSATVCWQTGTPADGLVHYRIAGGPEQQAGGSGRPSIDHCVTLTDLEPGTVYTYRVSSDTGKTASVRTFSHACHFLTAPDGEDRPHHAAPREVVQTPACDDGLPLVNPGFEENLRGWQRLSRIGRPKNPESFVPDAQPLGAACSGHDGYTPHGGNSLYGWRYLASTDPQWREPREDWKQEIIFQTVPVEPGRDYILSAWLLTGDQGRAWGRDSRIRLAVDEEGAALIEDFDTIDRANATQWFATLGHWRPVALRFTARADRVKIAVHLLQWWALQADYLYIDDLSLHPANDLPVRPADTPSVRSAAP